MFSLWLDTVHDEIISINNPQIRKENIYKITFYYSQQLQIQKGIRLVSIHAGHSKKKKNSD